MNVKLAHFELIEEIGKGGMATVFLAFDTSLQRHVAVKVINEELAQENPQFIDDFFREARFAAAITHPNLVHIYFLGEEHGRYYLVMELLEGHTLDQVLESSGPLDEGRVLKIATEVTEALKAAYAGHLVHGDIKPQNVFITRNGHTKLLDFGLAKLAKVDLMNFAQYKQGKVETRKQGDGEVWGSAYYVSPERLTQRAEDFRSDIYSLGATMFHALVGHPPFDAETAEELCEKTMHEPAPLLRQLRPDLTPATTELVAKMLEKTPFVRHLNYDALLDDLRNATTQLIRRAEVNFEKQVQASTRSQAKRTIPIYLVLGLVAGLILLCFGIASLAMRGSKSPPPSARITPTYVDATATNTSGSTFSHEANRYADGEWSIRTMGSNNSDAIDNTIFEAGPQQGSEQVPTLVTTLSGLEPGATYRLYAYFITLPTSDAEQNWAIRAGFQPDALIAYDHFSGATRVLPPGSNGELRDEAGNPVSVPRDREYRQIRLGSAVADDSGTIKVYVASSSGVNDYNQRTWFDGVGYRLLNRR